MDTGKKKVGRPRNTDDQRKDAIRRQREYISEWEAANYDKVLIRFPKGTKERIQATGETVNGFTVRVVLDRLDTIEHNK